MKHRFFRLLFLVSLICLWGNLQGQEITVLPGDFYRDDKDLTARIEPVKNENDQTCALLKVVTTEVGFHFFPDGVGLCRDVEGHPAEIWVWLAPGTRRITITHSQLGQLRDYEFPEVLQSATVYVMRLTTGRVQTVVEESVRENWLALTVNPPDAAVKIDGKLIVLQNGQYQKIYTLGEHAYEAFCDMYHPEMGTFTIGTDSTTSLVVELRPNYGYLKVESKPEDGAAVFVDGRMVGTTPYMSDRLPVGTYTVQVAKEMFEDAMAQNVTVGEGQTSFVTLSQLPDFAEPRFVCADPEAEIWVNGEQKGLGHWSGRLPAGAYKVEARRPSHVSTTQSLRLENGDNGEIRVVSPIPIYGQINVSCVPMNATIVVDGSKVGTTPKLLKNVLIGRHTVEVGKQGYKPEILDVEVEEGKTLELEVSLEEEAPVKQEVVAPQSQEVAGHSAVTEKVKVCNKVLFTLNAAFCIRPQWSFGLRVGMVRKWGWNVSLMTNFNYKCFGAGEPEKGEILVLNQRKTTRIGATAGVLWHPAEPVLVLLNVGYGYRGVCYQRLSDNKYYLYAPHTVQGVEGSIGLVLQVRGFVLSFEAVNINFKYGEFKLGIGGLVRLKK
ncbi:MAG: PEGA domain-containing protein [Bacteroidales bacterium]|nr:PEGA domain-containing protein [Bacteroidales bacterium]